MAWISFSRKVSNYFKSQKRSDIFENTAHFKTDSRSCCGEYHRRICDCGIYPAEESDRRGYDGSCHYFESFFRIEHFFGRADF